MDVMTTPTAIATAPTAGKPPPGSEIETPQGNPTSYKRHAPPIGVIVTGIVTYKECLKNHAATMGGHALDGCGEFMPAPTATAADPTSLKCAACGCHRNFHRREPEDHFSPPPPSAISPIIEYHPHHRHHPPPPSPPPISSAYYPGSAPAHMLLALSGDPATRPGNPTTRKRFRTKFTQEQKERMQELAEKVGWKMQKHNEDLVRKICSEIGVERGVFKVWMHNNKNTSAKRPVTIDGGADQRNGNRNGGDGNNSHSSSIEHQDQPQHDDHDHHHDRYNGKSNESNTTAPANASSSSS